MATKKKAIVPKKSAVKAKSVKKPASKKAVVKPTKKITAPAKKSAMPVKKAAVPAKKKAAAAKPVKQPVKKVLPKNPAPKPVARALPATKKPLAKAEPSKKIVPVKKVPVLAKPVLPPKKPVKSSKPVIIPKVKKNISMEASNPLTAKDFEFFRNLLLAEKERRHEEAGTTVHDMREEEQLADPIDLAAKEDSLAITLRTRDREMKLIRKIEAALDRIENKTYGMCAECGEAITRHRLEARPTAEYCIGCKEIAETLELTGNSGNNTPVVE